MFTGIIQAIGQIEQVTPLAQASSQDVKLSIGASGLDMSDVQVGDSIAVNGICLTAVSVSKSHFEADVSKETLSCTVGLDSPRSVTWKKRFAFQTGSAATWSAVMSMA